MKLADWFTSPGDRDGSAKGRRRPHRREVVAEVLRLEARTLMAVAALGAETRINAAAAGRQTFAPEGDRSIAVDPGGNIIAAWSAPAARGRGSDIVILGSIPQVPRSAVRSWSTPPPAWRTATR